MINSLDQIYEFIKEFRKGDKHIIYNTIYGEDAGDSWRVVNEDHRWNFENNNYKIVDNIDSWEAIISYPTRSISHDANNREELLEKVFESIKYGEKSDKIRVFMQKLIRS